MSLTNDTMLTMPVQPAYNNGGGGFGGWGGDWSSWIILFLIFGMFGWGGFGGGYGGGMNGSVGSEVQRGFDHSSVVTKLDGITTGIADATYALNNTMTNGFHGVDSALCNLGYQTQSGFNALSTQLAQCCCDNQRAIDAVRYDMATQACDTRRAIQDSTRQIYDMFTQDKMDTMRAKIQTLETSAALSDQNSVLKAYIDAGNAELLRRSGHDCPTAAYIVQPPTPVNFNNNGCGYTNYNGGCC